MEAKVSSRCRTDGSVDVWWAGWHVCFPPDAERPVVERGGPPEGLTENEAKLKIDEIGDKIGVGHGGWIVLLGFEEPKVLSPGGGLDSRVRFYRAPYQ